MHFRINAAKHKSQHRSIVKKVRNKLWYVILKTSEMETAHVLLLL